MEFGKERQKQAKLYIAEKWKEFQEPAIPTFSFHTFLIALTISNMTNSLPYNTTTLDFI